MKTNNNSIIKKSYSTPQIERIKLDNEISLALQSNEAPGDPEDDLTYLSLNPFKTIV